jgi:hypothetical protein
MALRGGGILHRKLISWLGAQVARETGLEGSIEGNERPFSNQQKK